MDPFEVRMQFLTLLHRLNASQQSIQKVVSYALKYFSRCGDLIWDCIVEECQKGSLNTRINILYLLDSLCEASLLSKASFGPGSTSSSASGNLYIDFVSRDLSTIVDYVIPSGREGLINLMSAVQILENWHNKRVIETQKVEEVLSKLESQKAEMHAAANSSAQDASSNAQGTSENAETHAFSRNEVFKRIEEDRERHKRLRERRWVQALVHGPQSAPILASFAPLPAETASPSISSSANLGAEKKENASAITVPSSSGPASNPAPLPSRTALPSNAPDLPIDIEFDNAWETTSDWNEDDDEAVAEENSLCYPNATTRFDSGEGVGPVAPATIKQSYSSTSTAPTTLTSGSSMSRTSSTTSRPSGPPPAPAPASSPEQGKRPFKIDRMRINKFADRRGN